jgi:hypothetical protein
VCYAHILEKERYPTVSKVQPPYYNMHGEMISAVYHKNEVKKFGPLNLA